MLSESDGCAGFIKQWDPDASLWEGSSETLWDGCSPQDSEPDMCDDCIRSDAVLISLMGDGKCHGEEPRLLPWPLPPLPAQPRCGGGTASNSRICAAPPPPDVEVEVAEPCEGAGVTVVLDWLRGAGTNEGALTFGHVPVRFRPALAGEPVDEAEEQ
mmetsp:Transcript_59994/g.167387  ORF Transcript_59994/g.167387 Transcript_59994/m.167387 type:complete len:157 (+) Transcript_59994:66-536(+)